jgi:hypothetical protein
VPGALMIDLSDDDELFAVSPLTLINASLMQSTL